MRKSSLATLVAVAAAGSTLLGGVALAATDVGGAGTGGTATNNCLNVGVPILSGIGIAGTGSATGASCSATANGSGGNAY